MRPLIGTILVLGALAVTAAPAAAAPEDFASGDGWWTYPNEPGPISYANFTGHGTPADPHGHVKIVIPDQLVNSKGSVDCVAVDGNRATISGVLAKPNPGLEGPFYAVSVEDNGSPGVGSDRISVGFGRFHVDCTLGNEFPPIFPLTRGNVVVRDRTP